MPYIVRTLRNNITLPDGDFYQYAQSTALLTDDEYSTIAPVDFTNGTLALVSYTAPGALTAPVVLMNVTVEPPTPVGGGVLFVLGGTLKYKGSAGTVTVLGPA